ncbi:hypothetical protein EW146_g7431 [Bondarzewia mesenterica]|uniref:6-phosphofructo-2-kinase domain-containing protein n=1 Tax=Bondarzewia mesenterica TaxID=1095465 RepID=A0A4S4LMP1_9AGAM|nr:hypothetical protein EW146_g7431 [Bondarzewia mesenterica]
MNEDRRGTSVARRYRNYLACKVYHVPELHFPSFPPHAGLRLVWTENQASLSSSFVCDDPVIIAANVALKVSSGDPDYKDMLLEDAKRDSLHRIKQYEAVYETITKPHLSYLRTTNVGSQTTVCRIHGHGAYFFPTSGDPVDNASSLGYTTSPTAQLTLPPAVYARAHSLRQLAEDSAFERLRLALLMK